MNLEINYLYRDAANYKQHQTVVVSNPKNLSAAEALEAMRNQFKECQVWPDTLHFRPEDLGWPTAYFDDHNTDEDDLDLHEIESIQPTNQQASRDLTLDGLSD